MPEITSVAADLMKIFAQRKYNTHRYDDTTAIELLKYLQTLAHAEKVPTPKLDQYLAGEYPPVDMGWHIDDILRNRCGMEYEGFTDVSAIPLDQYQDICKNIFPEIILKIFPEPVAKLDPYINLLPIWELELYRKVSDEVWYGSDELRGTFALIRDYIYLCVHDWELHTAELFFTSWNEYLLTQKWPDRIAELESELQDAQEYNRTADLMLEMQSRRMNALRSAAEEHYITLTDAARRVLTVEFDHNPCDKDVRALAMWLSRQLENADSIQLQDKRSRYFRCEDVLTALEHHTNIRLTAEQLRIQILDAGIPRSKIR